MGPVLPWLLAVGVQTARDVRTCRKPPVPSEFVASGAAFGLLTLLSQGAPELATVIAWGVLIAIVLRIMESSKGRPKRSTGFASGRTPSGAPCYPRNFVGPIPPGARYC